MPDDDDTVTLDPVRSKALQQGDEDLRALGYTPIAWTHLATGAQIHEENDHEPRFVVYAGKGDLDGRAVRSERLKEIAARVVTGRRGRA